MAWLSADLAGYALERNVRNLVPYASARISGSDPPTTQDYLR